MHEESASIVKPRMRSISSACNVIQAGQQVNTKAKIL